MSSPVFSKLRSCSASTLHRSTAEEGSGVKSLGALQGWRCGQSSELCPGPHPILQMASPRCFRTLLPTPTAQAGVGE